MARSNFSVSGCISVYGSASAGAAFGFSVLFLSAAYKDNEKPNVAAMQPAKTKLNNFVRIWQFPKSELIVLVIAHDCSRISDGFTSSRTPAIKPYDGEMAHSLSKPSQWPAQWRLRSHILNLSPFPLIMGIVNITPDSFSDGGLYLNPEQAIAHALQLLDEGADILDLGAESTRPGSHAGDPLHATVSADQEQTRLLPVIEGILKAHPEAILSIDTYKASTARAAITAGAEIVNDVSGLLWDPQMAKVCAELSCGIVLMHTRGKPDEWRSLPTLADDEVLPIVRDGLAASLAIAHQAGIAEEAIVLDPGYGFGKRMNENYALLTRQAELLSLGHPLLAGLSRKSFLIRALTTLPIYADREITVESRDNAGIAALTAAILNGASIIRVHSVRPALEAAAIATAILAHAPHPESL